MVRVVQVNVEKKLLCAPSSVSLVTITGKSIEWHKWNNNNIETLSFQKYLEYIVYASASLQTINAYLPVADANL